MSDKIKLETREVVGKGPLRCECGEPVVVTDDNGSIGCPVNCGWEGITLELKAIVLTGDEIEGVG